MKIIIIAVAGLLLAGCQTTNRIELVAANEQDAVIRDGTASLISAKDHVVMLQAVEPQVNAGERPSFVVAISNMGNEPVTFRASDIRARVASGGAAGYQPLKVYTYDELVAEERRRQTMQAVAVALGGIGRSMQAANAGTSRTYGTFNTWGTYGHAHGTYQSTTYD